MPRVVSGKGRSIVALLAVSIAASCGDVGAGAQVDARARERCDNGVDDDGNGLVDCADPACDRDRRCFTCGDGAASGVEDCDGADLRGKTCADFGFSGGELACHAACVLDFHACRMDICGDGKVTGPEQCDDGQNPASACCTACRAAPGCEIEVNDTFETASPVALDEHRIGRIKGVLSPDGDVDLFVVTIPTNSTAVLTAKLLTASAADACPRAVVEVLDAVGALIAGPACPPGLDPGCPETVARGVPRGKAYVRVSAPTSSAVPAAYELEIRLVLSPCGDGVVDEGQECDGPGKGCLDDCRFPRVQVSEPDDVLALARGPFTAPFVVDGTFDPAPDTGVDHDWLTFRVSRPSRLRLTLRPAAAAECVDFRAFVWTARFVEGQFQEDIDVGYFQVEPDEIIYVHVQLESGPPRYELSVELTSVCGDGVVEEREECDGGASCDQHCSRLVVCGDGLLGAGEECDDGNLVDGDGCSSTCLQDTFCRRALGDECSDYDPCCSAEPGRLTCKPLPRCFVEHEPNDHLDQADGPFTVPFVYWWDQSCQPPDPVDFFAISMERPGDVRIGSLFNHGACNANDVQVRLAGGPLDGVTARADEPGCLDLRVTLGAGVQVIERTNVLSLVCFGYELSVTSLSSCGDGVVSGTETCDDGSPDCLAAGCRPEARCGDGIVTFPEQCDDGNGEAGDGCGPTCVVERCGDGIVLTPEECDDGNTAAGDGCSPTCTREPPPPRCGDGRTDPAEGCDDGNNSDGDGCSSACAVEPGHAYEREPNDDGTPSVGNSDFSVLHAGGPFTEDVVIHAALSPPGDEDVFAVTNPRDVPTTVVAETLGPGTSDLCGGLDTVLRMRDGSAALLGYDDDSGIDRCSRLQLTVEPRATVFLQVSDYGDNSLIAAYRLRLRFLP